jgi:hypothetical protein
MLGWLLKKGVKLGVIGLSVKELNDYAKESRSEGKDPWSPSTFGSHYGSKVLDAAENLITRHKSGKENISKNMGGMMNARKKNMGLKYKKGGSVKSSSKKSRGTGAAIKGTKFKGVF